MDPTKEHHQILHKSQKKCEGGPDNDLTDVQGSKHEHVLRCLNGMLGSVQTEKGEASEEQSEEHAHVFLCHQGDCSQIIHPVRPNSQFNILL
jgi:hypothetical protein